MSRDSRPPLPAPGRNCAYSIRPHTACAQLHTWDFSVRPTARCGQSSAMHSSYKENAMETLRNYTFTWTDPRELQRAMSGKAHLEWMRGIIAGEAPPPPLASAFGFVF